MWHFGFIVASETRWLQRLHSLGYKARLKVLIPESPALLTKSGHVIELKIIFVGKISLGI
jgi:hypothetical protein